MITYEWIDLYIGHCQRTYGIAPCTAAVGVTGAFKCFNSAKTCQDRPNFLAENRVVRFVVPSLDWYLGSGGSTYYPSIKNIQFDPGQLSLGETLGTRSTLTITFEDHPDADTGSQYNDKYVTERPYDPFYNGSFFGKFRARFPFIANNLVMWGQGDQVVNLQRWYLADSFSGPSENGEYKLIAKDILKLADGDKALAPIPSLGFLNAAIDAAATSCTLQPAGIGASYPSTPHVIAIGGSEMCIVNSKSGDTITSMSRGYGSTPTSHAAGDRVQYVWGYGGIDPANIIYDLLVNFAGVNGAYINFAEWAAETAAFLNRVYTVTLPQPTSINTLISELCQQAGIALWWDDIDQKIRLKVIHGGSPIARIDETLILRDTLDISEQPDKRLSQVHVYFGQKNALTSLTDKANYSSVSISKDAQAEADYGTPVIKEIFSRWIPSVAGRTVADRLGAILLGRFRDPPRKFKFSISRLPGDGPAPLEVAGVYEIVAYPLQEQRGFLIAVPVQITRRKIMMDHTEYEADELLFITPSDTLGERNIIIDSNQFNVNLRTAHDSIYPAPVSGNIVTITINAGVIIGSTDAANPALNVGSWPAGVILKLTNNGRIQGRGGAGGIWNLGLAGSVGRQGGTAFFARFAIQVTNGSGAIWSGGGGGGASASAGFGGGGGAGQLPGIGGGGVGGTDGTTEAGGGTGPGGFGGGPGLPGSSPGPPNYAAAGAAGISIDGAVFVSFVSVGDIRGPQI